MNIIAKNMKKMSWFALGFSLLFLIVAITLIHNTIRLALYSNRFLIKNGKRYGHILNVKTGWPIENSPRSVTVASHSCIKAGMVATLAMLQGTDAESFLTGNEFKHWIHRD